MTVSVSIPEAVDTRTAGFEACYLREQPKLAARCRASVHGHRLSQ